MKKKKDMKKNALNRKFILFLSLVISLSFISQLFIVTFYQDPSSDSELDQAINKGIKYFEQVLSTNFQDLSLFQNAHALRTLNLLNSGGYKVNQTLLLLIKDWIEDLRNPNFFWNYTNSLPPDLDDTTAAISALYGLSSDGFIYETLDALINKQLPNGTFYTWLIPENESYTEEKLHDRNDTIDLEVNGIFGFYLFKINKERFSSVFHTLAEFLRNRQNEDGTWNETWYFGTYYGIYRVGSFLLLFDRANYSIQINKSLVKIISTINSDYGWGRNSSSNSLDTAFCMSFLTYYASNLFSDYIENASKYLINHQNRSGSWESVPFYGTYPKNSSDPHQIIIESPLFTTSFALEALYNYKIYREMLETGSKIN